MIFETFRQAIQNVWSNKLRTFLDRKSTRLNSSHRT